MTPPRRVNVPFYGHSSYKDQFPDYKFSPPVKQKSEELPSPNYRLPTVKFEGHTSYQDQFSGKAIQMQQYMTPQR